MSIKRDTSNMSIIAISAIVLYAIIAVASDIFANKMLNIAGLSLAGGILLIPFSFTIRDLMHRIVGYDNAKKIVCVTAIVNLVIAVLLVVLDCLPSAVDGMSEQWHSVMGSSWRIIVASFVAQLVADLSDTYVFEFITKKFGKNKVWARVVGSNLISTLLDSALFTIIAFLGVLPNEVVVASIFSSYVVKFGISVLATPIAYLTKNAVDED